MGEIGLQKILTEPWTTFMRLITNWQIMLGFILAGIGALFYLYALSKNDFSVVFPILGALGFIVLPLIGRYILNEPVSIGRVFGTIVIAVGMMIVAKG